MLGNTHILYYLNIEYHSSLVSNFNIKFTLLKAFKSDKQTLMTYN